MRKIMYYVHQSLDGFIEGPNGEFDWAELGPRTTSAAAARDWPLRGLEDDRRGCR